MMLEKSTSVGRQRFMEIPSKDMCRALREPGDLYGDTQHGKDRNALVFEAWMACLAGLCKLCSILPHDASPIVPKLPHGCYQGRKVVHAPGW
jgi:hypothetical protein